MEKCHISHSYRSFKNMGWPKPVKSFILQSDQTLHNTLNKPIVKILTFLHRLQAKHKPAGIFLELLLIEKILKLTLPYCQLGSPWLENNKKTTANWGSGGEIEDREKRIFEEVYE